MEKILKGSEGVGYSSISIATSGVSARTDGDGLSQQTALAVSTDTEFSAAIKNSAISYITIANNFTVAQTDWDNANGAKFILGQSGKTLTLSSNSIKLSGDTTFKNLNFSAPAPATSIYPAITIWAQGNALVFDEGGHQWHLLDVLLNREKCDKLLLVIRNEIRNDQSI